jgi:hypothetical protein
VDRERVWAAHIIGDQVVVRHYVVLEPGEELDDDPPTETMSLVQWKERCADFGCNADGTPVAARPGVGGA